MNAPARSEHAKARAEDVLDGLAQGVVVLDPDGCATAWNAAALRLLRRTELTMRGARPPFTGPDAVLDLAGAPAAETHVPGLLALARDRGRQTFRRVGTDGSERWVELGYVPLDRGALACTIADVTEWVDAEQTVRADRDRESGMLDALAALVVVLSPDGRARRVNAAACTLLGAEEHELDGADWIEVAVPARERPAARGVLARLTAAATTEEHPIARFEAPLRTVHGDERGVTWRATLLRDDGEVTAIVLCGQDVTERRRTEERLRFLAHHDRLTGLPNAALLDEHLGLAIARARRLTTGIALLWIDLAPPADDEHLRDVVVREAAIRLRAETRAGDLLARMGPDELVLMLTDLEDPAFEADVVATRALHDTLGRPLRAAGREIRLEPSAGIALLPEHADNAADLLRRASEALDRARAQGGGAVLAEQPRDDGARGDRRALSVAGRLRRAIERDELDLHFQPVRSPADGRLHGAEALVRWNDPARGLVGPAAFLPEAEEAGLIAAIDEWVLDRLCRLAGEWGPHGALPQLSFNVSVRELRRGELSARIIEQVAAHGLDPATFCVELPEAGVVAQPLRAATLAGDLGDAGFAVAIDDVRAAAASESRLRELPSLLLKLDRGLLAGVPSDRRAASLAAAVLARSRGLGATAVAKGVETEAQRAFLLTHGTPLAQGFLLGRPLLAAEMEALVESRRSP